MILAVSDPPESPRELMFEEDFECVDERVCSCLTRGTVLIGTYATHVLLDGVDLRNPRNGFGGDRRITALGDLVEFAPQVAPTEGARDHAVDTWGRVCPVMRVCRSATAMQVIDALEQARQQYDLPMTIRVDQESQFTSKELDLWAYANAITFDFSRPGQPTDNAYAESFNATVRLECLARYWFLDLDDAREKVEPWRASSTTK